MEPLAKKDTRPPWIYEPIEVDFIWEQVNKEFRDHNRLLEEILLSPREFSDLLVSCSAYSKFTKPIQDSLIFWGPLGATIVKVRV